MQTEQAIDLLGDNPAPLALFDKHAVAMGEVIEVLVVTYTLERRTMEDLRITPRYILWPFRIGTCRERVEFTEPIDAARQQSVGLADRQKAALAIKQAMDCVL